MRQVHITNGSLETANGGFTSINNNNLFGPPHDATSTLASTDFTNRRQYWTPEARLGYDMNYDQSENGNLTSTNNNNLCGPPHFTSNDSTSANLTNPGTYQTPVAGPWYGMNDDLSMAIGNLASTNDNNLCGPPHFTTSSSNYFTNPGMYWTPDAGPWYGMNNNLETTNRNFTSTYNKNLYSLPHITTNNASSANFPNLFCQIKPL